MTIHKWLSNYENSINIDVIIIDESSMIDSELFYRLFNRIIDNNIDYVIIVGDNNQLPSIGAGNVFKILLDSEFIVTTTLTKVFRQNESALLNAIYSVKEGKIPKMINNDDSFIHVDKLEDEQLLFDLINEYKNDLMILTPTNKLIDMFQDKIARILNPLRVDNQFNIGDKILQIKNSYDDQDKELFNGMEGRIIKIENDNYTIYFENENMKYTYKSDELYDNIKLGYIYTIHKSQGSENDVVVILLGKYSNFYTRNLIYTAISRAKNKCIIIGLKNDLFKTINNTNVIRYSQLDYLLNIYYHN